MEVKLVNCMGMAMNSVEVGITSVLMQIYCYLKCELTAVRQHLAMTILPLQYFQNIHKLVSAI